MNYAKTQPLSESFVAFTSRAAYDKAFAETEVSTIKRHHVLVEYHMVDGVKVAEWDGATNTGKIFCEVSDATVKGYMKKAMNDTLSGRKDRNNGMSKAMSRLSGTSKPLMKSVNEADDDEKKKRGFITPIAVPATDGKAQEAGLAESADKIKGHPVVFSVKGKDGVNYAITNAGGDFNTFYQKGSDWVKVDSYGSLERAKQVFRNEIVTESAADALLAAMTALDEAKAFDKLATPAIADLMKTIGFREKVIDSALISALDGVAYYATVVEAEGIYATMGIRIQDVDGEGEIISFDAEALGVSDKEEDAVAAMKQLTESSSDSPFSIVCEELSASEIKAVLRKPDVASAMAVLKAAKKELVGLEKSMKGLPKVPATVTAPINSKYGATIKEIFAKWEKTAKDAGIDDFVASPQADGQGVAAKGTPAWEMSLKSQKEVINAYIEWNTALRDAKIASKSAGTALMEAIDETMLDEATQGDKVVAWLAAEADAGRTYSAAVRGSRALFIKGLAAAGITSSEMSAAEHWKKYVTGATPAAKTGPAATPASPPAKTVSTEMAWNLKRGNEGHKVLELTKNGKYAATHIFKAQAAHKFSQKHLGKWELSSTGVNGRSADGSEIYFGTTKEVYPTLDALDKAIVRVGFPSVIHFKKELENDDSFVVELFSWTEFKHAYPLKVLAQLRAAKSNDADFFAAIVKYAFGNTDHVITPESKAALLKAKF